MAVQDEVTPGSLQEEGTRRYPRFAKKDPDATPWWAEHWYRPGVGLGVVALVALGWAPWAEDNCARTVGSALTLLLLAVGITVLYLLKALDRNEHTKEVEEARREVRVEWDRERQWEHCHEHCSCGHCQTQRYQKDRRKAIGA